MNGQASDSSSSTASSAAAEESTTAHGSRCCGPQGCDRAGGAHHAAIYAPDDRFRHSVNRSQDGDGHADAWYPPQRSGSGMLCGPKTSDAHWRDQAWLSTCVQKLKAGVEALSATVSPSCMHLVHDPREDRPHRGSQAVTLVVWKTGLQLHHQPLAAWGSEICSAMLRDILEGTPCCFKRCHATLLLMVGTRCSSPRHPLLVSMSACRRGPCSTGYFPSTLRAEFPDGVPVRLVDKSACCHVPDTGVGSGSQVQTLSAAPRQALPQTAAQYLQRLPQTVIRNGKVIHVRDEVGKVLASFPVRRTLIHHPAPSALPGGDHRDGPSSSRPKQQSAALIGASLDSVPAGTKAASASYQEQDRYPRPGIQQGAAAQCPSECNGTPFDGLTQDAVTLRIKAEDGKQVYVLQLTTNDTMRVVYGAVRAQRAVDGEDMWGFELRGAFPTRAYAESSETLAALELAPNATLFVRAVSQL